MIYKLADMLLVVADRGLNTESCLNGSCHMG